MKMKMKRHGYCSCMCELSIMSVEKGIKSLKRKQQEMRWRNLKKSKRKKGGTDAVWPC